MSHKSLLLAGCFVSFCAWGSCDKPADPAPPQSTVHMPDYTASIADNALDSQEAAMQTASRNYQDSVFNALSHSPNPRDWALATLTTTFKFDVHELNEDKNSDLLQRAMQAAPDDALVHWIAINRGEATHYAALQALRALEPDNAAVWIDDLNAAAKRKDDAGIDTALAKMSASHRFDVHFADLLRAATEVYLQHPVPEEYFATAPSEAKLLGRDTLAYTTAMAVTAAAALPAFQHLVNACRVDPASGKNHARAADCAMIGRLMATHGDMLLANRIGYSLLRVSQTYTDEDLRVARGDDWVYLRFAELVKASGESADQIIAYQKDWIETNSEMEAMRRRILRAGVSVTPPDDWTNDSSVFRAERLRTDAEWFEKNAAK